MMVTQIVPTNSNSGPRGLFGWPVGWLAGWLVGWMFTDSRYVLPGGQQSSSNRTKNSSCAKQNHALFGAHSLNTRASHWLSVGSIFQS